MPILVSNQKSKINMILIDIIFLTLSLGSLFFILLGVRPLWVPDEGRYAEIIREMLNSGNLVTPYLNGIKYFEKPPLFYWLGSIAVKLIGLNIWSIRSINALLGLLGCLITYWTGYRLYNRRLGLFAAFILGTSTLYFVMTEMISLDLTITFFLTFCLYSFLLATQESNAGKRLFYISLSAAAAGCAVLTKGLIGILFPGLIIGIWLSLSKQWRVLKQLYLPSSLLIFLIIVIPWHLLVQKQNPEFFYFYFIEQQFLRYTTLNIGHYQPVWYFIPILIIGFFPWVVFLPQMFYQNFVNRKNLTTVNLFFLTWIVFIFIFFSFSKSKLIPYILPIFPALAMLTANYLVTIKERCLGIAIGSVTLVIFSIIIASLFYYYSRHATLPDPSHTKIFLTLAGIILILGNSYGAYILFQKKRLMAIYLIIATTWLFLFTTLMAIPAIDTRSIRSLAQYLKPLLKTQDVIITYNQYFQDLPFYLERRVVILNWQNELTFGMQHQNTQGWMIDNRDFWQYWNSSKLIYVIMSKDEYGQFKKNHLQIHPHLLAETMTNVLISNQQ